MRTRAALGALLLISFALRLWLGATGGQRFWPDESRYNSAQTAAQELSRGEVRPALAELFGHADHVLFRPASLPVALVEHALGGEHPVLVSAYFSLFSVGVIFLVWAVARRAGAPKSEALWTAFLAASANTLFFYARFYLPYDAALCVLMGALWLALGRGGAWNSLLTGAAVGAGFLTYNGYWLLGAAVLVLHTLLGAGGLYRIFLRAGCAALGLVLVVALVLALGGALGGGLAAYAGFAGSVVQGDFRVGYRVIPEYLGYAERGVAVVWVAALAYATFTEMTDGRSRRLAWWLGGAAIVFGGLVFFCDVVPRFMVYGRLTRAAVPFLCLGAAQGIDGFIRARGRSAGRWSVAVALLVAAMAAANFSGPLSQVFPADFIRAAQRRIADSAGRGYGFYRILFSEMLWGRPLEIEIPPHRELKRSRHPMQFRPYQFEGYSAAQRAELNRLDIAMRLVEFDARLPLDPSAWDGYPGPVRLEVAFHPESFPDCEPLVTSGSAGVGDLVYVRYLDSSHVAFGLDHWNSALIESEPVELDLGRPHELMLSAGSLLPPEGSPAYAASPEAAALRNDIVVMVDGRVVLSRRVRFFPSAPRNIIFGADVIGGSTTRGAFTGSVSAFAPAPLDTFVEVSPSTQIAALARRRPPEWAGAVGPLRLNFRLPAAGAAAAGLPLLALGPPASGDTLYIEQQRGGLFRVCFDSRGRATLKSAPLRPTQAGVEEMELSIGSMLPGPQAPLYARLPGLLALRSRVHVRLNGQLVLFAERPFEPVGPRGVTVAENAAGSSVCVPAFSGDMAPAQAMGAESFPPYPSRLSATLAHPAEGWGHSSGPVRLWLRFPAGRAGATEPLLVSGEPGAADGMVVRYEDDGRVRFGYAHSGSDAVFSEPVEVPPGSVVNVLLSMGSLMPEGMGAVAAGDPELPTLGGVVEVAVGGRPVLFVAQKAYRASPDEVELGANLLGRLACEPRFHGEIEWLAVAEAQEALGAGAVDPMLARDGWDGYPGPLRMRIVAPPARQGLGQPLVTTGFHGGGDFLFLAYEPDGRVRLVQDHWGSPLTRSDPFELAPGTEHELTLSFGALFPPDGAALYQREPAFLDLRGRVRVTVDGRTVLSARQASHPTPPQRIIIGANLIGGSSAAALFAGRIVDLGPAPVAPAAP